MYLSTPNLLSSLTINCVSLKIKYIPLSGTPPSRSLLELRSIPVPAGSGCSAALAGPTRIMDPRGRGVVVTCEAGVCRGPGTPGASAMGCSPSCGVMGTPMPNQPLDVGPSPRPRGLLGLELVVDALGRFIPASAGSGWISSPLPARLGEGHSPARGPGTAAGPQPFEDSSPGGISRHCGRPRARARGRGGGRTRGWAAGCPIFAPGAVQAHFRRIMPWKWARPRNALLWAPGGCPGSPVRAPGAGGGVPPQAAARGSRECARLPAGAGRSGESACWPGPCPAARPPVPVGLAAHHRSGKAPQW